MKCYTLAFSSTVSIVENMFKTKQKHNTELQKHKGWQPTVTYLSRVNEMSRTDFS